MATSRHATSQRQWPNRIKLLLSLLLSFHSMLLLLLQRLCMSILALTIIGLILLRAFSWSYCRLLSLNVRRIWNARQTKSIQYRDDYAAVSDCNRAFNNSGFVVSSYSVHLSIWCTRSSLMLILDSNNWFTYIYLSLIHCQRFIQLFLQLAKSTRRCPVFYQ